MDHRRPIIRSIAEAEATRAQILSGAARSADWLRGFVGSHSRREAFDSLATSSGRDIESVVPNLVAAEVFSATHPGNNQKLKNDIARLAADPASHRYVFFAAPGYLSGRQAALETSPGVEVHCVEV